MSAITISIPHTSTEPKGWYGAPVVVVEEPMGKSSEMAENEYEGFTKEQFMSALKAVSRPMSERALKAKEEGMLSVEESRRLLDEALNAGS